MRSVATRRFWALFHALPGDVQELAIRSYQLWRNCGATTRIILRSTSGGCRAVGIASLFESEIAIALSAY